MNIDIEQSRREAARWAILRILDAGRPVGVNDTVMLSVLEGEKLLTSWRELQRESGYLSALGLLTIEDEREGAFAAKLTAAGVDVVEYTASAPAGIARPTKAEAR